MARTWGGEDGSVAGAQGVGSLDEERHVESPSHECS